jgi:hypothetical protein
LVVGDVFEPLKSLAIELLVHCVCVIAVVGEAPCQCFSPGGNHTTSPGRIPSIGPLQRCTRPEPAVTISVWPSGCVCHAVRALGSKVTVAPRRACRAGA